MKTTIISSSKKEVFDAVKQVCVRLELRIKSADATKGRLAIVHDGGFLSFGNDLRVTIIAKANKSLLKVSSRSSTSFQLIDWGVNSKLETKLIREIKNILRR